MDKAIQNMKFVSVTPPAAIVDNASYTTAEVDTLGFDFATYVFYMGATDIAVAALSLTESDVTASGHVAITGANFATGADIAGTATALPTALQDNSFFVVQLDLRKRKRFLDCTATAGDGTLGTYAAIFCILSSGDEGVSTNAEFGATAVIRV